MNHRPGKPSAAVPPTPRPARAGDPARWQAFLAALQQQADLREPLETDGRLARVAGLVLEAAGVRVPVGSICEIRGQDQAPVTAEVVGFSGDRAYLMPTGALHGLTSGARVVSPDTILPPSAVVHW